MNGWKEHLLVICLFLVLTFLFTLPFALHAQDAFISGHVDNALNVWILSWNGHAFATAPTDLFQANINYPSPDSLAFSEGLFSLALVAAPVSWITGNAVLAYNLVSLIGFALCAYTMYLLVKYLTGNRPAAFLSGVFFAFVPYHFSTIVHVHVSLYFLQPLILLFLFRYAEEGKPRFLVGLGIAFTAQALMSWYQLAFSSVPIALFILWRVLSPRRRDYLRRISYTLGTLALCMLLVVPFALPYFRLHRNMPEKESQPAIKVISSARSADYLRVLPQNYLYHRLGFLNTGSPGEGNALFPGFLVFPLSVLALAFALTRRRRSGAEAERAEEPALNAESPAQEAGAAQAGAAADSPQAERPSASPPAHGLSRGYLAFFAVLGLTCFVLSLGPEPHGVSNLLYKGLHKLPVYGFVRFPIRYHIMVLLSLAVVAGYGATWLYHWVGRRRGRFWAAPAVGAVAALMLLEFLIVNLPYTWVAVGGSVPQAYRDLEGIAGAVVVEAPMPVVANSVLFEDPLTLDFGSLENTFLSAQREQDAVYFSIYHWKKLLNGMSGYYPLFYRRALVEMLAFPGPRARALLRGAGVSHVLLHWDFYPPQRRDEVRGALEGAADVTLVEDYPDGLSLYRLEPLDAAAVEDIALGVSAPEAIGPGLPFSASLGLSNHTGMPFINTDESRQRLKVEWRDEGGRVVKSEDTYFYAPFFIAAGEGAIAPFRLDAPRAVGSYSVAFAASGGLLDGEAWEADITVKDIPGTGDAGSIAGELSLSTAAFEAAPSGADASGGLRFYPGQVISLPVRAANNGPALWQREGPAVEGSVVITAAWTREGDPEYEMLQQGMLPCDMSPGQGAAFPVALQAPTETGSYTLTLRLNCLGITYIGDPITIPVSISR